MMLVSLAFLFSLEGEATTDPEYTERNCCLFYTRKGNGSHGSGSLYKQCSCLHVPRKRSSHVTVLQNVSRWRWDPFPSVNAVLEKTIKRAVWRWVIGSGFLCSRSQATWELDHIPFFWQASRDAPSPQPELLLVTSEDQVSWHLLESAGTVMTSVVNCWVREAEMKQVGAAFWKFLWCWSWGSLCESRPVLGLTWTLARFLWCWRDHKHSSDLFSAASKWPALCPRSLRSYVQEKVRVSSPWCWTLQLYVNF